MRRMLVYNIQIIFVLYQPVSVKYLSDECVLCTCLPVQEFFLKQVQLFRLL